MSSFTDFRDQLYKDLGVPTTPQAQADALSKAGSTVLAAVEPPPKQAPGGIVIPGLPAGVGKLGGNISSTLKGVTPTQWILIGIAGLGFIYLVKRRR